MKGAIWILGEICPRSDPDTEFIHCFKKLIRGELHAFYREGFPRPGFKPGTLAAGIQLPAVLSLDHPFQVNETLFGVWKDVHLRHEDINLVLR